MIDHSVENERKVSDRQYDLVVKGQGHTYLNLVYDSKRERLFNCLTYGVHIRHYDCLSCVDYNKSLRIWI